MAHCQVPNGDFMNDLDLSAIGARIKGLRGEQTQKDFATLLGVGRTSVIRYESGERTPDAAFIAKCFSVLGVDPIWLLTGSGSGSTPVISPRKAALLNNYDHCNEGDKRALERHASLLSQQEIKIKTA
jgi:transcriptional regulator with XRE-family HTH domain